MNKLVGKKVSVHIKQDEVIRGMVFDIDDEHVYIQQDISVVITIFKLPFAILFIAAIYIVALVLFIFTAYKLWGLSVLLLGGASLWILEHLIELIPFRWMQLGIGIIFIIIILVSPLVFVGIAGEVFLKFFGKPQTACHRAVDSCIQINKKHTCFGLFQHGILQRIYRYK